MTAGWQADVHPMKPTRKVDFFPTSSSETVHRTVDADPRLRRPGSSGDHNTWI
ncbi:MAG: hypothetical protein KIT69_19320 [Propionibacteriaceae bacterium]|nr:hypothetical protein [Propionibacteriaceae bacterium]